MNEYVILWAIIGTTYCLVLMAGIIVGFIIQQIKQDRNKK